MFFTLDAVHPASCPPTHSAEPSSQGYSFQVSTNGPGTFTVAGTLRTAASVPAAAFNAGAPPPTQTFFTAVALSGTLGLTSRTAQSFPIGLVVNKGGRVLGGSDINARVVAVRETQAFAAFSGTLTVTGVLDSTSSWTAPQAMSVTLASSSTMYGSALSGGAGAPVVVTFQGNVTLQSSVTVGGTWPSSVQPPYTSPARPATQLRVVIAAGGLLQPGVYSQVAENAVVAVAGSLALPQSGLSLSGRLGIDVGGRLFVEAGASGSSTVPTTRVAGAGRGVRAGAGRRGGGHCRGRTVPVPCGESAGHGVRAAVGDVYDTVHHRGAERRLRSCRQRHPDRGHRNSDGPQPRWRPERCAAVVSVDINGHFHDDIDDDDDVGGWFARRAASTDGHAAGARLATATATCTQHHLPPLHWCAGPRAPRGRPPAAAHRMAALPSEAPVW